MKFTSILLRPKKQAATTLNAPPTYEFVQRYIRPRLPPILRYGVGWNIVWTLAHCGFAYCAYLYINMVIKDDDQRKVMASEYVLINDDRGRPVDIGFKPLVDAATRAKERSRRISEGDI